MYGTIRKALNFRVFMEVAVKKIAILRCLKTSASCAGASCLKAFFTKTGAFEAYGEEELQLMAMWTCNGCGADKLENQEGLEKKIARMESLGVDIVQLSGCTRKKNDQGEKELCPTIKEIAEKLEKLGVEIRQGTHHA